MYNFELNNEFYIEKIAIDIAEHDRSSRSIKRSSTSTKREPAWVRNHKHKRKLIQEFCLRDPALDLNTVRTYGRNFKTGIYLNYSGCGGWHNYNINPCNKLYISERGTIRRFRGSAFPGREGSIALARKSNEKTPPNLINGRVRRLGIEEDDVAIKWSYYRKLFAQPEDRVW